MSDVITLEEEHADAIYLLNLLNRRNPTNVDRNDLDDVMDAQDELDDIVKGMMHNFNAYCVDEGKETNEQSYIEYIASEFINFRQNRLLQSIEIYHALNTAHTFATEKPEHSLSKKFSNIASSEDITLLRQYIEYDLQSLRDSITENLSAPEMTARKKTMMKSEKALSESPYDSPERNVKTIDFSIDTLLAYGIGMVGDELEFITAVAVKSQIDQTSQAYLERKEAMMGLLQRLGKMSETLVSHDSEQINRPQVSGQKHRLS